jgi:hypothetical protein
VLACPCLSSSDETTLFTWTDGNPSADSLSYWSRMSAMSGDTTTVMPGFSSAGTW